MEKPNGTDTGHVPGVSNAGETFPPGDAAQNTNSWNLFTAENLNYGVDLAAFVSGMMSQDDQIAPMDDVYYW